MGELIVMSLSVPPVTRPRRSKTMTVWAVGAVNVQLGHSAPQTTCASLLVWMKQSVTSGEVVVIVQPVDPAVEDKPADQDVPGFTVILMLLNPPPADAAERLMASERASCAMFAMARTCPTSRCRSM